MRFLGRWLAWALKRQSSFRREAPFIFAAEWLRLKSHSASSRDILVFWLNMHKHVEAEIAQAANRLYGARHPKHFLWTSHAQYVVDAVHPGERVLDIGCSATHYPQLIAEKAASLTCVDIREELVRKAALLNSNPKITYRTLDVTSGLPEGEFDVAICSHVIEHLEEPVHMLSALAERVPRLVVRVPREDSDWIKLLRKDLGLDWFDDSDHKREYNEEMLAQQLTAAGWRIIEMSRETDLRATAVSTKLRGNSCDLC